MVDLRGKTCLIVLDDVWSSTHTAAFTVAHDGQILITTRIAGLGGKEAGEYDVGLLSPEQSLNLLAETSGFERDE